ncbi:hypothetical protein RD792_017028 [Penstemon davidsonii]|uniref:F-box/LRR-repeat protein 15/At3g58940/PEG3-like LRR domain-containing protein n=1 Tax=Penstemon davidsonii TaxID=160366 RepID=A0ABR0CKV9_9LAMI|nr:hypothetical protein RD792_017028 [Penstemon davidsonii]
MNFVDKLLLETLCDGPSVKSVESVFLRYSRWKGEYNKHEDNEKLDKKNDEKIVAWVSAALRLNVINLSLVIPRMIDENALFHTLNGCATLVELELMRLPGEFTLPNLKSLFLYSSIFHGASINTLLGGCPVLNELSFSGCDFHDNLYVKSPLLKLFVICDCIFLGEVVFDAPNIEVLAFQCANGIPDWVGADFKSLHSAYIEIDMDCDYDNLLSLAKIVKACSSATRLCLSGYEITVLHTVSVHLSAFRNITWMAFDNMDNNGFELLACFLNSAPIVQTLTIGGLATYVPKALGNVPNSRKEV